MRSAIAMLALVTLTLGACGHSKDTSRSGNVSDFSNVVVLMMENREYDGIIGSKNAPYINSLARKYALARSYYGIDHPSLTDYMAATGGSTFGIKTDCLDADCPVKARNLVDQLEEKNISWKGYMEDLPETCYQGAYHLGYSKAHNPFFHYDNIINDPARCAKVVSFAELERDLEAKDLPKFAWISPNLCHDMHDCSVRAGDRYLSQSVPRLLSALGPRGALFLTWDEGKSNRGCCEKAHGGHIVTIVAGPAARAGVTSDRDYDHYSLLRTIEDGWGLARLREAACPCSAAMTDLIKPG